MRARDEERERITHLDGGGGLLIHGARGLNSCAHSHKRAATDAPFFEVRLHYGNNTSADVINSYLYAIEV